MEEAFVQESAQKTVKEIADQLNLSAKAVCAKLKEKGLVLTKGADLVPEDLAAELLSQPATGSPTEAPSKQEVLEDESLVDEVEYVTVWVSSSEIETYPKSVNGVVKKFLSLSCNSEKYELECDSQQQLPVKFYGCVEGLLERQKVR